MLLSGGSPKIGPLLGLLLSLVFLIGRPLISLADDPIPLGIVGVIEGKSKLFPAAPLELGSATRICLYSSMGSRFNSQSDYWITPAHVLGNTAIEKISDTSIKIGTDIIPIKNAEMIDSAMDLVLFSTVQKSGTAGPCVPLAQKIITDSAYSPLVYLPGKVNFYNLRTETPDVLNGYKIKNSTISSTLFSTLAPGRPGRDETGELLVFRSFNSERGVSGSALLGSLDQDGNIQKQSREDNLNLLGLMIALKSPRQNGDNGIHISALPAPTIHKRISEYFNNGRTEPDFSVKSLLDGTGVIYQKSKAINHDYGMHTGAGGEGGGFGVPLKDAPVSGISLPGSDRLWLSFADDWSEYEVLPKKYVQLFETTKKLSGVYEEKKQIFLSSQYVKIQPWLNIIPEAKLEDEYQEGISRFIPDCVSFSLSGNAFKEEVATRKFLLLSPSRVDYCEKQYPDGGRTLWLRLDAWHTKADLGLNGLTLRIEARPAASCKASSHPCPVNVDARVFYTPIIHSLSLSSPLYRDAEFSNWLEIWKYFTSLKTSEGIPLKRKGLRYFYNDQYSFLLSPGHGIKFEMFSGNSDTFSADLTGPLLLTPIKKVFAAYE